MRHHRRRRQLQPYDQSGSAPRLTLPAFGDIRTIEQFGHGLVSNLEQITNSQSEYSRIHDLRHAAKLRNGLTIDVDGSRCGVDPGYRVRIECVEKVEQRTDRLMFGDLKPLFDADVCQFPSWVVVRSFGFHINTADGSLCQRGCSCLNELHIDSFRGFEIFADHSP